MPLTPKAKEILAQIQVLNPDSKYIFIRNGQHLATVTFNRRLKKCCEELGIEYRSSQKLLGHTSLNMTHHYLRNITSQEETASKMRAILD